MRVWSQATSGDDWSAEVEAGRFREDALYLDELAARTFAEISRAESNDLLLLEAGPLAQAPAPLANRIAVLALVGLLGLGAFFVARLFRGNASHGIVDDGTGVAILLELAKHLKSHPIPDTQFTFGFFGAEEAGLVGQPAGDEEVGGGGKVSSASSGEDLPELVFYVAPARLHRSGQFLNTHLDTCLTGHTCHGGIFMSELHPNSRR